MSLLNYVLIGQTPVPEPDLLTWARTFEHSDRRVALTSVLDLCEVSTIFLGIDYNFDREGPPILFETMVFWSGERGWECDRCSTWTEAERQHARMIREVAQPANVLRFALRALGEAWRSAIQDWKTAWRELS
jgi:hypothetical protein